MADTEIIPTAEQRARWTAITGDEYGAVLCATAEITAQHTVDAQEAARSGAVTLAAVARVRAVRDEARADVADYYADDLAEQPLQVRRIAGWR